MRAAAEAENDGLTEGATEPGGSVDRGGMSPVDAISTDETVNDAAATCEAKPGVGITGRAEVDIVGSIPRAAAEIKFDLIFTDRIIERKLRGAGRRGEERNHARGGTESFANHQTTFGVTVDRFERFDANFDVEIAVGGEKAEEPFILGTPEFVAASYKGVGTVNARVVIYERGLVAEWE